MLMNNKSDSVVKTVIACLLTFLMMFSSYPVPALAEILESEMQAGSVAEIPDGESQLDAAEDDSVELREQSTQEFPEMTLEQAIDVSIEEGGYWVGSFTAPSDGTYTFFSSGTYDTYGELYSDERLSDQIDTNDDDGENNNFSIKHALDEGQTVYLKVRQYSYEAAAFTVSVETIDTYDLSLAQFDVAQGNYIFDGSPIHPNASVTDASGRALSEGTDYVLCYRVWNTTEVFYDAPAEVGHYAVCAEAADGSEYRGGTEWRGFYILAANNLATASVEYSSRNSFTGSPVDVGFTLTLSDGTILSEGTDYTLVYRDSQTGDQLDSTPFDTGSYFVQAQAIQGSGYEGTTEWLWFEIYDANDISSFGYSTGETDFIYDGEAHQPTVSGIRNNLDWSVLEYDVDYTFLEFRDESGSSFQSAPTEVGSYYAVYKGIGLYHGELIVSFRILDRNDLETASLSCAFSSSAGIGSTLAYTGSPVVIEATVKTADNTTLSEGVHYELAYYRVVNYQIMEGDRLEGAPTEIGEYAIRAEAVEGGGYTGKTNWEHFSIVLPNDLALASVDYDYSSTIYAYTGSPIKPELFVTAFDGTMLFENVQYRLAFFDDNFDPIDGVPTEIGDYFVNIEAVDGGGYVGNDGSWQFEIVAENDLKLASFDYRWNYAYTGSPIEIEMTVTAPDGTVLSEGVHYRIAYFNESTGERLDGAPTEKGFYSAIVEAIDGGGYIGQVSRRFDISDPSDLRGASVEIKKSYAYTGSPIELDLTVTACDGTVLTEGTHYITKWVGPIGPGFAETGVGAPVEVGNYLVYIEAVDGGGYSGHTDPYDFSIVSADDFSAVSVDVLKSYVYTGNPVELEMDVTTFDGTELTEGIHYVPRWFDAKGIALDSAPTGTGRYVVYLEATDNGGYTGKSKPFTIEITPPEGVIAMGTWGTCPWEITSDGTLTVHPGEGAEQVSVSDSETYNSPWIEFADSITTVSFVEEGGRQVIAPSNASFLLYNLSNVTSADLSGLNTSGSESLSGFFAFCSSLTSLDLSDWDTSNVTKIDSMFFSCHSLVSLDVAGWNTSSVEDAAWLFNGCSSLTALNLSGWNTSAMKYMGYMFSSCSSLTSLNLSGWITSSMESAGLMFSGCSSLTSLNVSSWETSNATYLFGMFYGCSSLVSLNLSGWDTSHVVDMGSMFSGCSGLTTLYAGDLWSTESVENSSEMFSGCTSLVGGNGTVFDDSHADVEYARIDEDGAPGYLTSVPKIDISGFSWSCQDIDYDGAAHEPVVTIWDDGGSELVYGVDYVFKEYRDDYGNVITAPSEVGSYRVVCRGIGSYGGELEIWFRIIDPYDISSFSISNYTDAIAYDGAPHEPTVTVWDTDWMELEYGVDYTLKEFRDDRDNILQGAPTEIGSYRAVYQGISPYRGELETWFNIVGPNDLSVASVAMSDRYEYTGSPVELGMTVTAADGTVLTEGVHYALVFEDGSTGEQLDGPPSEIGDYYSVTAEAIDGSGYSGRTGWYYFRIFDAYDIAGFNYWQDGDSAIAYDGEQHEPSVKFRDYDGRELEYGVGCVIGEFRDSQGNILPGAPSEVGEYIAVYQGIGSYHGEREVWFRIYDPFDLANCSAYSRDWRFAYDGAAHAPANVVMTTRPRTPSDPGTKLEPGTDYVFVEFRGEDGTSFQDAPIEVGEYRAVYRGIGSYHGELERNFRIYDPHDISNGFLELSSHNVAYTGSPVDPEASLTMPDGTSLTEGVHYVLRYEKNGRPLDGAPSGKGYYDVWAEAIDGGGYTGATWRNSFYIVAANDLALATVDVGQYYVYTGSPVELDIAVTMPHGTVLTEGVDYTLVYHDWRTGKRLDGAPTEIDRYDVEIVAVDGGLYTGSAGGRSFSIVAANDLGLATVDVDRTRFPYTGAPIDPEVTVTMPDGTVLTEGVDYSLMWGYDRSDWVLDGAPTEVGEYWVHATAVDDGGYVGGGSQWIAITIIDSSKPIASGTWGTCPWEISYDGVLTVHPGVGASQVGAQDSPWASHADIITSVVFKAEGGRMVVAPKDSSRLFFRLSNVEAFDFSGFDTSSVANMSGMFGFCRALHEVDLSSWNTSSVTNMQGMFNECTALVSLDLSRWNTSSVTDMDGMFMWCDSLSSLEVSTWDTSSVKKMSSLFYGCHALTSLDLSGWDTSAVTDMTGMFACGAPDAGSALTTIFVGDTWSTDAVKKSDWMFNGRTSLVGGNGTAYDSNHIDAEYARIDAEGAPGYLTSVPKIDISGFSWSCQDIDYDGAAHEPAVTIWDDGGSELVYGVDYVFKEFRDDCGNVIPAPSEIGSYYVVCRGIGSFGGEKEIWFRIIDPNDISSFSYSGGPTFFVYDGRTHEPTVTISQEYGVPLEYGKDYELLEYRTISGESLQGAPSEVGEYFAVYQGIGSYRGELQFWFRIVDPLDLDSATVTLENYDVAYTGSPVVLDYTVTAADGTALTEGVHYSIEWLDSDGNVLDTPPVEIGRYSATLEAIDGGGYHGSNRGFGFIIRATNDLAVASVDLSRYYSYTGSPVNLGLTVTAADGNTLVEGTHYSLKIATDKEYGMVILDGPPTDIGRYYVMLSAIDGGGYVGSTRWQSFEVVAENDLRIAEASVNQTRFGYTGSPVDPGMTVTAPDGSELEEGVHYELMWALEGSDSPLAGAPVDVGRYWVNAVAVEGGGYTGFTEGFTIEITPPEGVIATGMWGTCPWEITSDGTLTVHPGVGASQLGKEESPWSLHGEYITKIVFARNGARKVVAPNDVGYLFCGLTNLETVDAAGFDTSSVMSMHAMFRGCTSLTSLDLSSWYTSNVTDMFCLFDECTSLSSLDISGWDTSYVTDMFGMFRRCTSLTSLDLSGFDTSNVSNMSFMFAADQLLASVDLSNWNTSTVKSTEWMFIACSSLTSLDLSSWDTSKVTSTYSMFNGCSSLATIFVRDGWTMENVVLSDNMFDGCTALVGGSGTAFDSNHTDGLYARIDVLGTPGYLTRASIANIKDATIAPIPDQDYTGNDLTPEIAVTFNGKILVLGTDFTVRYSNNKEVGIAVIILEGIGNFGGMTTATFRIVEPAPPSSPFRDVYAPGPDGSGGTPHYGDIIWLASAGVSAGWIEPDGTRTFRPTAGVQRADMAAFLYRLAGSPEYYPSQEDMNRFVDVNASTPHAREIWWLAHAEISTGWDVGGGRAEFRPSATIVRQDMAAFLFRLASKYDPSLADWQPTEAQQHAFSDVDPSTPHAREVFWLASSGVSTGWDVGGRFEFRGMSTIIRQDMAAFLHRMEAKGLVPQLQ